MGNTNTQGIFSLENTRSLKDWYGDEGWGYVNEIQVKAWRGFMGGMYITFSTRFWDNPDFKGSELTPTNDPVFTIKEDDDHTPGPVQSIRPINELMNVCTNFFFLDEDASSTIPDPGEHFFTTYIDVGVQKGNRYYGARLRLIDLVFLENYTKENPFSVWKLNQHTVTCRVEIVESYMRKGNGDFNYNFTFPDGIETTYDAPVDGDNWTEWLNSLSVYFTDVLTESLSRN